MYQAILSSKGQITIPKEIRDILGLETGDSVIFRAIGNPKTIVFEKDNQNEKMRKTFNIDMLREFSLLINAFSEDNNLSFENVAVLFEVTRFYKNELTGEQIRQLLEIPLDILENLVELKVLDWAKKNRDYFTGNMAITEENEFLNYLKKKFESATFELEDVTLLTRYIHDNIDNFGSELEFLLRIPEVTIRDDVRFIEEYNLEGRGLVYSKIIEKVIWQ